MRTLSAHRTWFVTAMQTVLGAVIALVASPVAAAAVREQLAAGPPGSTPAPTEPLMLASTGLDITEPIIVGLGTLALGTAMVGWAFLATGRQGRHR